MFKKTVITMILVVTMALVAVSPAFAFYGAIGYPGVTQYQNPTWPLVLTGWTVVSASGSSTVNFHFTDSRFGPVTYGLPDLSTQYSDWNQPNNMSVILWGQAHHFQMPLNSAFWYTGHNDVSAQPCQYTPQILSVIEASGYTPSDFYSAGKSPLPTKSQPATAPATSSAKTTSTATTTQPNPAPTPAPAKTETSATLPTIASANSIDPQTVQKNAQEHSDPSNDPSSMIAQTQAKLDQANQQAKEQAQDKRDNLRLILMTAFGVVVLLALGGIVIWKAWKSKVS